MASKYKNTWLPDINYVVARDRQKKHNADIKVPYHQQALCKQIDPDKDWSECSDKDIRKYLQDLKKKIQLEVAESIALKDIDSMLEHLNEYQKIEIYCFGDVVARKDRVRFVRPLLFNRDGDKSISNSTVEEIRRFLIGSDYVKVDVMNRKSKKFEVFYTGSITNNLGTCIMFSNSNNGFAVTLG